MNDIALWPIPEKYVELCAVGGCGNRAVYLTLITHPLDGYPTQFETPVCADHEWADHRPVEPWDGPVHAATVT